MHLPDVLLVLLGAALVAAGVLAAAVGDRIRGPRNTHKHVPRAPRRATATIADSGTEDQVVGALIAAGYPRRVAAAATAECSADHRASVEAWVRAALARCARGEA